MLYVHALVHVLYSGRFIFLDLCVSMCTCVSLCVYVHVCVFVSLCMHVCVRVCV